ncbi:MAG: sodium:proton antiporter [Myxococcota bacterium]|nr:sodium:proton antiporter [Myxococcota bacterium]
MEAHTPHASFTFAIALGAAVAAQLAARHLRVPSIVVLLGVGVALGPDGLGVVMPRELGDGLFALVSLAVAIILFEGGLNLDLSRLRHEASSIRRLVTVGAVVTFIGAGLAAWFWMGWPPGVAALFGSLVVVTGPTVIKPLLRNVPLRPRLATVLEGEGLLIDPVGAILAAVVLQYTVSPGVDAAATGALGLLQRGGFGLIAGLVGGFFLVGLLRVPRAVPEGLENLVALAGALVLFASCEAVLGESGILAVTVAGVVVGNFERHVAQELGEFQEHLTVGLIGVLFVLLAADVRLSEVFSLGLPGLMTVVTLALVVRPINVWISTPKSDLNFREKVFLSWMGPRGVVAAAIASISAAFLAQSQPEEAAEMRALVFLTIAMTVVIQGGTAPLVARALGVRAPGRHSWVILGAESLSLLLGDWLRRNDTRVVFVDSNPTHCRDAEQAGFAVVFGDALSERTLARARLERARGVIGLTPNSEVNHHFAGEARDQWGVRESYVAVDRAGSRVTERIVEKQDSRVLFDGPKDVERWHVRVRHGATHVQKLRYADPGADAPEPVPSVEGRTDPFLILALARKGAWLPMSANASLTDGDEVVAVIHSAEEPMALEALASRGLFPVEDAEDDDEAIDGEADARGA